jgi:dolichol kinase
LGTRGRRLKSPNKIRLLIHFSGFLVPFLAQTFGIIQISIALLITTILYIISEYGRIKNHDVPLIGTVTRLATKGEEVQKIVLAPVYFSLGIILSILIFHNPIGYASVAILSLGDGMAKLFGSTIGKTHLPLRKGKTLEGSIFFFIFAFLGAILFVPYPIALIGAIVGVVAEYGSVYIDDNIMIPITSGIFMYLIFII